MPSPPLIYDGPNAGLVNEVIACAFSASILTGTGADPPRPLTVITDMREAVDAAGGVGPRGFIRIELSEMQRLMNLQDLSGYELELDWHDLQSNLGGEVHLEERVLGRAAGMECGQLRATCLHGGRRPAHIQPMHRTGPAV